MQYKKMFKMDFSFSFSLPYMLVILTITDGRICTDIIRITGNTGGNISIPLKNQNLSVLSVIKETKCAHPLNVSMSCMQACDKQMCLRDGVLQMSNLSKEDEGMYTLSFGNETKTFFLGICDLTPAIHIHCLPDGKVSLSCEMGGQSNDSIYWTLNGSSINDADVCMKDDGKRIILEKGIRGKLVCHRRNACRSSSVELLCNNGDLLQHPLFLYVLVASGGGAVLLAIAASLVTCCCMKRKHNFIRVPVEDEKDDGITMSAISSERPKSPPNGDHCEATDVLVDSNPNSSEETCESFKPEPKVHPNPTVGTEVKSEPKTEEKVGTETECQEIMVDSEAQEVTEGCFPDPTEA